VKLKFPGASAILRRQWLSGGKTWDFVWLSVIARDEQLPTVPPALHSGLPILVWNIPAQPLSVQESRRIARLLRLQDSRAAWASLGSATKRILNVCVSFHQVASCLYETILHGAWRSTTAWGPNTRIRSIPRISGFWVPHFRREYQNDKWGS